MYYILFNNKIMFTSRPGPAFSKVDQLLAIGSCTGVIYSWLFKYTQHATDFTGDISGPVLSKASPA
jgi:hypothetical protein